MSQEPGGQEIGRRPAQIGFEDRAASAPAESLWAQQKGVDFFLPPALTTDALTYLDPEVDGIKRALRMRFGLR